MPAKKPYTGTRLTRFLEKRILELRPTKTQAEIAVEAGYANVNMLSIIKAGGSRLAIDRVPPLAKALDVDPARLLQLALEQEGGTTAHAFNEVLGRVVSRNEIGWLDEIRDASNHTDPALTTRARSALRAIFGK